MGLNHLINKICYSREIYIPEAIEDIEKFGFCYNDWLMGLNPCYKCKSFNYCHKNKQKNTIIVDSTIGKAISKNTN